MLELARQAVKPGELFFYYEIGIGRADTMIAVDTYTCEWPRMIVGVDIPGWQPPADKTPPGNVLTIGSEEFLSASDTPRAHFILIDACHGSPCVKREFTHAEQKIHPGGIIAFHDADPNCQGRHFQDHCGMGIDVRAALEELGLLNDTRLGWRKVEETWGDQYRGGHGMVFVQRLSA